MMNLMTAYRVIKYFEKEEKLALKAGWKLEQDGGLYLNKVALLRTLNKQQNLNETLEEMVGLGMLDQRGKGERGNTRQLALGITGRQFIQNFSNGLAFVFGVNPETWVDFISKVDSKGRDQTSELSRVLKSYAEN